MRAITKEWVEKAEDDFYSAELLLRAGEHPMPGNSCFHSQQCGEKYLKAFLVENNIDFPRSHQLMVLLELCAGLDVSFLGISQLCRRWKVTLWPFVIRASALTLAQPKKPCKQQG
jgi:HEPN domain-containing protein